MLRAAPCAALTVVLLLPAAALAQPAGQPPLVPTTAISYAPVPLIAPYQWLPAGVEACWRGLRDAAIRPAPEAPPAPALLEIRVAPPDALIVVDGQARPLTAGRVVVTVAPGGHLVRILAPGYASHTVDVQVEAGHTASLDVKLVPATN